MRSAIGDRRVAARCLLLTHYAYHTYLKPCILISYINITFLDPTLGCQSAPKTPKFSSLPREYGGTVEVLLCRSTSLVVANRTLKHQNSHSCLGDTEVRRRLGWDAFGPLGVVRPHLVLMAHLVCSKTLVILGRGAI